MILANESKIEARCGVMDGEITSQVDGNKQPSVDDQSNFGTGYGYQYGATEGTIELFMNGKWWIFATEEARQKIQFPSIEDELSKFYLTIGSEGVKSIKLSMPGKAVFGFDVHSDETDFSAVSKMKSSPSTLVKPNLPAGAGTRSETSRTVPAALVSSMPELRSSRNHPIFPAGVHPFPTEDRESRLPESGRAAS